MVKNPLTPAEMDELRGLLNSNERGNRGDALRQRAAFLLQRAITPTVREAVERELPRIRAQHNAQRAAVAAGQRAGQRYTSATHRAAQDAVIRNNRKW